MTENHSNEIVESVKNIVDMVSLGTLAAAWAQILNPIATLFTIVWAAIRIYESKTVQSWLGKDKTS